VRRYALHAVVAAAAVVTAACSEPQRLNLLVVTLDTTRADRLGCYGRDNAMTPTLDRLADTGTLFLNCSSAAPVTTPSHSTIFTGTYPVAHGVRDNGLFVLPAAATTMAELLQAAGYVTGAAVASFPVTRRFGLDQGFDYFNDHITVAFEDFRGRRVVPSQGVFFDERPAAWVNDAIVPWIESHRDRPFAAWVHYWDPHQPLHPPAPFDQLFSHDLYQGEVAYVDHALGALLDRLEAAGVAERTVVVVVGDHGEGHGEHNEATHSLLAYEATLHVPLIVFAPGRPGGGRVAERVGTVDVLPTVLELLGLPVPAEVQGRSLLPLMRGRAAPTEPVDYYAEALSPRFSHGWGELRVLYRGGQKYIHGPRPELYDLESDPAELDDLSAELPADAERLRADLQQFIHRHARDLSAEAAQTPDQETLQRLAALGYLTTGDDLPTTVVEELSTAGAAPQDRVADVSLWSTARQQLDRKSFLAAKESIRQLLERDPGNAHYQGMMALAMLGLGQAVEAAQLVEEGGGVTGDNAPIYLGVVVALFNSGLEQRALDLARRITDAQPSAHGLYLVAEMEGRLGNADRQLDLLDQAFEQDPAYIPARLSLAIQLARQGATQRAAAAFESLVAERPLYPRARLNYGILLAQDGRLEEAMAMLERTIELSPTYWQAHLALLAVHVDRADAAAAAAVVDDLRQRCRDRDVVARAEQLEAML
jgi:arylsulfatase A-like enzyme/Tfp pilus assembly protein PilF